MSYILEALKKSDAERKRGEVPTLDSAPSAPQALASGGRPVALIVGVVALAVTVGGAGAWWMLSGDAAEPSPAQVAPEHVVQAEATPEPAPKPAPTPQPQAAPTPKPEAAPEPVPMPVAVAEPAPEPKVESDTEATAPPIPAPSAVAEQEPAPLPEPAKPQRKPVVKSLPALSDAGAYVDRAWSSMDKGLYAQAVADLDKAVAREPAFADAWFARGWANEKNGDEQAAIHDYGRAIDAQPGHAFALFSRGFLNLYGGNARDAVLDFVRTQGVAGDDSLRLYSHLWLYLARAEAGQSAQARLKDDAQRESLANWPGPLVLYFMGAMNESAVLDAIEQGPRASLKERRATGYFFLGVAQRMAGNARRARAYFEKTLATGAVDFRQYDAAKRELDRLN